MTAARNYNAAVDLVDRNIARVAATKPHSSTLSGA